MSASPAGPLLAYLALAYAFAWAFFVPVMLRSGPTLSPLDTVLATLGAWMPSVAALLVTWRTEGAAGVRALLARIGKWRVALRWYALALLFTVTVKLGAAAIVRLTSGAWPRFGTDPIALIPFAIAISTPFQAGEEIGWRGFALPRLAERFGLAGASLVLGAIWALWHLPLFFVHGADKYGQSFPFYALHVIALSVVMAFLYERTRGSLLLVMLMHAAVNNSKDVVPSAATPAAGAFGWNVTPVGAASLALMGLAAAWCLFRMRFSTREGIG